MGIAFLILPERHSSAPTQTLFGHGNLTVDLEQRLSSWRIVEDTSGTNLFETKINLDRHIILGENLLIWIHSYEYILRNELLKSNYYPLPRIEQKTSITVEEEDKSVKFYYKSCNIFSLKNSVCNMEHRSYVFIDCIWSTLLSFLLTNLMR